MNKPRAISLFSGQGGLDIGVENAGFEVLCAIELNSYACATLRQNRLIANMSPTAFDRWYEAILRERHFTRWSEKECLLLERRLKKGVGQKAHFHDTEVIEGDIRQVDPSELMEKFALARGELDLMIGGPPCQSFSRSGKRESVNDERGQLFLEFARFVDAIRPRWFVFENVKGILMTKTNVPTAHCSKCDTAFTPAFSDFLDWREAGATPECPKCGAREVRVSERPDSRGGAVEIIVNEFERLGYRCQTMVLNALNFGAAQNRERFFIVGSRDSEPYTAPLGTFGNEKQASLFTPMSRARGVWDVLFSEPNPYHDQNIDPKRAVLWVKNVVRPHAEPVTWPLSKPAPTVGAHQAAKLAIAPFGVPEEQLFRQQWHTLGRRQGDTPPVPVVHSYLSDEDLLKLQTFPDYWFVAGTRMERAFQIGNAVPPILAEAVARSLNCGTVRQAAE